MATVASEKLQYFRCLAAKRTQKLFNSSDCINVLLLGGHFLTIASML